MLLFVELVGQCVEPIAVPTGARIANNAEEPSSAVSAGECPKISEGPERRLLHDVFRILLVSHQPAGKTMSGVEMWQNDLIETRTVDRGRPEL